ncbi:hypothetical protein [Streptomyces uncialis]|uniref:hypothetical protein n=1 Tax=Streptomyces uncialis TaxID=1048205 RepID=UPI00386661EA|nr:hypothetical protein OG268_36305 [Streptomyces uncialis]
MVIATLWAVCPPEQWAHAHGTQPGQPVLLRADGWSVPEVNGFFASARMRNASAGTRWKYAFAVAVWLGLDAAGRTWLGADEDRRLTSPLHLVGRDLHVSVGS